MGKAQQVFCPKEQLQVQDHCLINAFPILGVAFNFRFVSIATFSNQDI